MNIIDLAKQAKAIVRFDNVVRCPKCEQKQFSAFDKLFTVAYDMCVDCIPAEELDEKSTNIFAIVEAEL